MWEGRDDKGGDGEKENMHENEGQCGNGKVMRARTEIRKKRMRTRTRLGREGNEGLDGEKENKDEKRGPVWEGDVNESEDGEKENKDENRGPV